jgi:Fe2+ transport system protein FeoA
MTLRELKEGDRAIISRVRGRGPFRRRLMEMGFIPGETVFVERYAPLRDPIEFVVKEYHVSLRREEAAMVEVIHPALERAADVPAGRHRGRRRRHRWGEK